MQLECKVKQVIELGAEGGAGNLIICEVVLMHVASEVLDANNAIDVNKIDLVARMGGNYYCRASGNAVFEIAKPLSTIGIGVDAIPLSIRNSKILTGNNLGQLGNTEKLPTAEEISEYKKNILHLLDNKIEMEQKIHQHAKQLLADNKVSDAWKTLLSLQLKS